MAGRIHTQLENDFYSYTRQQRAFEKLMDRSGPRPAAHVSLHTERFDDEDAFAAFCQTHEFITNIIHLGHGTWQVEYMA
jgi:hypothetical protein